jgi:hypothetical protein
MQGAATKHQDFDWNLDCGEAGGRVWQRNPGRLAATDATDEVEREHHANPTFPTGGKK